MQYEFDAEQRQKQEPSEEAAPASRTHNRPQRQRRPSQMGKLANVPEAPKAQFMEDNVNPDVGRPAVTTAPAAPENEE